MMRHLPVRRMSSGARSISSDSMRALPELEHREWRAKASQRYGTEAETAALLADQFELEERGVIELKGRGAMQTWWVSRAKHDRAG